MVCIAGENWEVPDQNLNYELEDVFSSGRLIKITQISFPATTISHAYAWGKVTLRIAGKENRTQNVMNEQIPYKSQTKTTKPTP